uniref:Auxin response factor n=1 Tax=Kalanchoe fedtschenkoi TaxID=63787 RepID=A0A7N0TM07_KALFE
MDKCLDPQLWHACAGGMVQMPPVGTNVFYFPQGHSEHASSDVDFRAFAKLPSMFLCRVSAVKYMADPDSDEVFAKIRLLPTNVFDLAADDAAFSGAVDDQDPPASFAKTLTQSDANNGGGFSVPRYCAETIFPRLDYTADPPVQTILAKDVHGQTWKFRHIYRGTPRRHLLTTGWSNFVNHKKLVAGDSIVFLRDENGELCVGVRRATRGIGGCDPQVCWNPAGGNFESTYGGGDDRKRMQVGDGRMRGRVKAESVLEAVSLAASGKPFQIVYYPRAGTPEFCVRASVVSEAMRVQWCCGMRFKMPFETEDSSRISWFMGTISAAQVADPVRWPNSPWRLLQVAWDEPDLLQNVKRVSPWLVEVVSNMPSVHLTPFSPPRKKVRLPQHPDFPLLGQFPVLQHSEFPSVGHFPLPPLAKNLLGTNSPFPAGIQGARHGQFGLSSSDLHFNKLQSGLFPVKFQQLSKAPGPDSRMSSSDFPSNKCQENDGRCCSLTMGRNVPEKISNVVKAPMFVLFGQPILTEEQISQSSSDDTIGNSSSEGNQEKVANVVSDASRFGSNQNGQMENSSDDGSPWLKDHSMTELKLQTGHCNDASPPLGFSILSSYGDLHTKLTHMFSNGEGLEVLRTQLATNPLGTDSSS